jgi:LysR family glycine cleavage system transcriptional activator
LPLNALRAFEAVGRKLSFTAGAQSLNVSQSAVSRHIIALEDLLGHKLFDRSVATLVMTPAGEALLPQVTLSFDRLEQTLNAICQHSLVKRPIRLHVPPSMLQQIVLPILRDFRAAYPEFDIDIHSSRATGLPEDSIDMAIVFDRPTVDDRVTDLLWRSRVAPVCSPQTAATHAGKPLEQFLADNMLLHVAIENQPRGFLWRMFAQQMGIEVQADRDMSFDTVSLAVSYAIKFGGVALADIGMFADEIASGELCMPYDSVIDDGFSYYLTLRAEDLDDPAISLLRTWFIAGFSAIGNGDRTPGIGGRDGVN